MEHDEVDGRVRVLRGAAQRHVAGDDAECAFEIDPVGNARQRHVVSGAKEAMAHPLVHRRAVGFDRRQVERLLHQFAVRWKGRAVAPFPCARQIVPPNALAGEGRRGGIGEQARSCVGIEAVCGDHREISIADVVRKDDIDALAIVDQVPKGEAQGGQRGPGSGRGRPGSTAGPGGRCPCSPGYPRPTWAGDDRDALAVGDEDFDLVEPLACGDIFVERAELVHRPHDVRLLHDPDAVNAPVRVAFDQVDVEALASQRDRGRQTADAAADHIKLSNSSVARTPRSNGLSAQPDASAPSSPIAENRIAAIDRSHNLYA